MPFLVAISNSLPLSGMYLENDLIALRSVDKILDNRDSRPTIMAERMAPEGVPNWLIFSRAKSPFLKRWMEAYAEDKDWNELATRTTMEMLRGHDPHLQVMSGRSWFYPLASALDSDASLKKLWFGKSWHDIDESYGTHLWHWLDEYRDLITPDLVRAIDTPLFCRLRPLFNEIYTKSYKSWSNDPNCFVTRTFSLDPTTNGLFADYAFTSDASPIKTLDTSGHNLHGWAPNGTALSRSGRTLSSGTFIVFPTPLEWDTRAFTLQLSLSIDPTCLSPRKSTTFLKLRLEHEEELTLSFRLSSDPASSPPISLVLHWSTPSTPGDFHHNDILTYSSPPELGPLAGAGGSNSLTISLDRLTSGLLNIHLNDDLIATKTLPLIRTPKFAQDIWLNKIGWDDEDAGFRGEVRRMTLWADAIPGENISTTMAGPVRGAGKDVYTGAGKSWGGGLGGGKTGMGWAGGLKGGQSWIGGFGGGTRSPQTALGGSAQHHNPSRSGTLAQDSDRRPVTQDQLLSFLFLLLGLVLVARYWGKICRNISEMGRYIGEWVSDLRRLGGETAGEVRRYGYRRKRAKTFGFAEVNGKGMNGHV